MKKSLLPMLLFLASAGAFAQSRVLENMPVMLQGNYGITMQKSINQERDVLREGNPLRSRCDIYSFTLTRKQRDKVLKGLIEIFESVGHKEASCYSINTLNAGSGQYGQRNLIIGDDLNRYVSIGQDYDNYININLLDTADTTHTHRYAYALEWKEGSKGSVSVRYVITYALIPKPQTNYSARATWPLSIPRITAADSLSMEDWIKEVREGTRVLRGQDYTADDLLCDDNIVLTFAKLKQQYLDGVNREFAAISIYLLCRRAREYGFFRGEGSEVMLKQMKDDLRVQISITPKSDRAIYYYLQHALVELELIK